MRAGLVLAVLACASLLAASGVQGNDVAPKYSFFDQNNSKCMDSSALMAIPYDGVKAPWYNPTWTDVGLPHKKLSWDHNFMLVMYRFIYASYLAFCNGSDQVGQQEGWTNHGAIYGWDVDSMLHEIDPTKDVKAYYANVLERDDAVLIAVRGSASVSDWIKDLSAFKKNSDEYEKFEKHGFNDFDGKIHHGFWNAYSTETITPKQFDANQKACNSDACRCKKGHGDGCTHMRQQVRAMLGNVDPSKPIYITGHSLGGAIATLVAYGAQLDFPERHIAFMSFGSPRVGDPAFAAGFNAQFPHAEARAWRIADKWDIVTKVPTTWMDSEHVGRPVLINPDIADRTLPEWGFFFKRVFKVGAVHCFAYEDYALKKLRRDHDSERSLARPWEWSYDQETLTWTHDKRAKN